MAESGRLDELKRKFDENPRRYFAPLANEYRKAGDTDRAIELCRTYLPQQPSHMSGYIVYGQALFDAGRADEAAAVFKQALTLDPENIIALRYLGDIARSERDSAGAMRWYGKVLELDPRNEEIAGYITALASPSGRPIPRNERVAPPTIRPEPEFDASAVALSQLVTEPDKHQPEISRAAPSPEPEAPSDPLIIFEESFEVISWPHTVTASDTDTATERIREPVDEPVQDQSSELNPGEGIDSGLEGQAPSFADFDAAEQPRPSADSPFVTETMAELYVQQGLDEDALVIYRQLVVRGADPRLLERIAELEGRSAAQAPEPAREPGPAQPLDNEPAQESAHEAAPETVAEPAKGPTRETVRQFFTRIGAAAALSHPHIAAENENGLASIFGSAAEDADDLSAAQSLAGAFSHARADPNGSRD